MDKEEIQEQNQFELLIKGLIDDDYGCCNDFILPNIVTGLRDNIHSLSESGNMKPSGVGNREDFQKDTSIRGDKINWINE